jgi:TRAP-type C4-dicarboxylate transport system permease small subunit
VGRSFFDAPLVGDYELVQLLSAVAVAMALPYANWIGAHVIVDFFTAKAPRKANAFMDTVAHLLLAFFAGLLSWRLFVGMLDLRSTFDASMLLDIPTWWAYAPMVPSFALLCATSLYAAADNLRKLLK